MPRPTKKSLPTAQVQEFRDLLTRALDTKDEQGRRWGDAKWGVYAFFDYEGEPIYVGQTNEQLRVRIRRHLTNQRTDSVAMRVLDPFEVAEIQMFPIWEFEGTNGRDKAAKQRLNALEYSAYLDAIQSSRYKAILNEVIPPVSVAVPLPSSLRVAVISSVTRAERGHPDVRIARRAETISRLAAVAHERGEVTIGLRRVLVIQAIRLTHLSAERLAFAEGRPPPQPSAIDTQELVGEILVEDADTTMEARAEEEGEAAAEALADPAR